MIASESRPGGSHEQHHHKAAHDCQAEAPMKKLLVIAGMGLAHGAVTLMTFGPIPAMTDQCGGGNC